MSWKTRWVNHEKNLCINHLSHMILIFHRFCFQLKGVALCIGQRVAIDNFRISMESAMPQKKFGTIELTPVPSTKVLGIKGFESATLGQLRKILADIGHENQFFALTGIDPSNENNNAKSATKGSGSGKGKKKKKK